MFITCFHAYSDHSDHALHHYSQVVISWVNC